VAVSQQHLDGKSRHNLLEQKHVITGVVRNSGHIFTNLSLKEEICHPKEMLKIMLN
jgi:hypothetical protein